MLSKRMAAESLATDAVRPLLDSYVLAPLDVLSDRETARRIADMRTPQLVITDANLAPVARMTGFHEEAAVVRFLRTHR